MFTVISNPSTASDLSSIVPRTIETGNALALLTDRQFHVCGDNMKDEVSYVSSAAGGAFLAGDNALKYVTAIRTTNPLTPVIVEPRSFSTHWATTTNPFAPSWNPIPAWSLDAELDWQRNHSDLAITPTGQIRAGDITTVRAVLNAANALERSDTLAALPLAAGWLSVDNDLSALISAVNESRHPVLLMFTDKRNPVASKRRLSAYRRLFSEITVPAVAYRTGLAGFDAIANGGLASAIGSYPSLRLLKPIGTRGGPTTFDGMSPHMFIPDMLRFQPSAVMRNDWFAAATPISCFCSVCQGQNIDRLRGSNSDRYIGHAHNVVNIDSLYSSYVGLTIRQKRQLWADQIQGALDTFPQLETHIGRVVPADPALEFWAS